MARPTYTPEERLLASLATQTPDQLQQIIRVAQLILHARSETAPAKPTARVRKSAACPTSTPAVGLD